MPVAANSLHDVLAVLSGARGPQFQLEPEMRFFQLKVWLLNEDPRGLISINYSAVLFASIVLRNRIHGRHRRFPKATPSELITAVFQSKSYRELYDIAFAYPKTPYQLSLQLSLMHLRDKYKETKDMIAHLNALTKVRLMLNATEGYPFSLNAAQDLDGKLKKGKRTGFARTNLSRVHRERQTREAFLFVAEHYDPALLQFETTADHFLPELHAEVADLERFKNLFGRAITALEILTPNGLTAEQVREWTLLDAMPLDVIEPFTKAELEEVGFFPTFRRAAETIRIGKRQAPIERV